jgi:hypothetical protein
VREERNILCTIKGRNTNWVGHILPRDYLLKHVIEGKIGAMGKQGRRRKQLLDDLKETRRRCWKLREETLDRTLEENSLWKRLWTCRKTDYRINQ